MVRCVACSGVYRSTLTDGTPYFHVCPPLSAVVVERDGERGVVAIEHLRGSDRVAVVRDNERVVIDAKDRHLAEPFADLAVMSRPHGRDENIAGFVDGKPVIKAEGLGVEQVAELPIFKE